MDRLRRLTRSFTTGKPPTGAEPHLATNASSEPTLQDSETSSSSQQDIQKAEQALNPSSTSPSDPAVLGLPLESNQRLNNNESADEKPSEEQASPETPPRNVHGFAWTLVVVAIISSMFLFGLDQTITADVQPAIIDRFDEIDKLPWVSVTLLLGASASNLFWGQIYTNYNAKWIYLVSFVIFELGSVLCAASPTINVLIGGRALCGFGGTGLYNGVMTILSTSTTEKERPLYMSIPGLAWGSSTVLGPVIGGAFTISAVGWRWGFYINLCIGGACLPVYLFLVPSKDPRPELPLKSLQRIRAVDLVGFILLIGIFVSLLMGINFGGLTYPWNSGSVIALFVVAGVLVIIFMIQQVWVIGTSLEARSFPMQFLRNPTVMVNFFNQTASATATFLPIYFIPLYFQFVRGDSALEAAVRLLPYMAFLVATVILEGYIMSNVYRDRFMPWFYLGGALVLVGSALMYTVTADTSNARIYGYSILLGTGTGAYLQMPFAVAQAQVSPTLVPMAVAFTAFAQLAGPAITLSMANSIFLNEASNNLLAIHIPGESPDMIRELLFGAGSERLASLSPMIHRQVLRAIVRAMSKIYIIVIVSGALTLVLTVLLTFYYLRRKPRAGESAEKESSHGSSA